MLENERVRGLEDQHERIHVSDYEAGKNFYKNLIKHFLTKNGIKSDKGIYESVH
ncbi:hypothetical protein BH10PAT2_BH10PAT2_3870 [soil metagenome]